MSRTWRELVFVAAVSGAVAAGCGGGGGSSGGGGGGGGSLLGQGCQNFAASTAVPSLWTLLSPTGTAPAARKEHAFAYDAANDRLMIHGGRDGGQSYGDSWVLVGASGAQGTPQWLQVTTGGAAPPQRFRAAAAYNPASNTFLLFGGSAPSGQIQMDLWLLTNANGIGTAGTWSPVAIGGTAPSPRGSTASAYDPASDTLILFGGGACSPASCTLYNEVWLVRSATTAPAWQKLTPTGAAPSPRSNLSAVYDPATDRLILFGGNVSTANPPAPSARVDETWVLSGVVGGSPAWSEVVTAVSPPARAGHSAVFDAATDRMTVFAGAGEDGVVRSDVWILADSAGPSPAWAQYLTGTPQPSGRASHAAVFAGSDRNRMVVFGGDSGSGNFAGDAWVLRNANGLPSSPVASIDVVGSSTSVCDGYTLQLTPLALDAAGNQLSGVLFTWATDDPTVADVRPDGLVTAVGGGTTIITASVGDFVHSYGPITVTAPQPPPTTGGGSETWTGTFEAIEVFDGVWTCTYTTRGNITLSLLRNGTSVSGTNTISILEDTVVSEDPTLGCPPQVHCPSQTSNVTGAAAADGSLAFSFFGFDCGDYPPFTATVAGASMSGTTTSTSSMTTRTLSFSVTRQ